MKKTIHLIALGQSNLANHCEHKTRYSRGRYFYNLQEYPLVDPIKGGSGEQGSIWPTIAQYLLTNQITSNFYLSLLAQGQTAVDDWHTKWSANLQAFLTQSTHLTPEPTHIIYHQGERDTFLNTSKDEYKASFKKLYTQLRSYFPQIPFILCCTSFRKTQIAPQIIQAQEELCQELDLILGPNTDLLDESYRYDQTHFNSQGQETFGLSLALLLQDLSS